LLKYRRLIAVMLFLAILFAVFRLTGLNEHFTLASLQQKILANRLEGLLVFVLLFALGNLIQIPGWLFLAAAVLTLGRDLGGVATYVAACISCVATFLIIRFVGGDCAAPVGQPARELTCWAGSISAPLPASSCCAWRFKPCPRSTMRWRCRVSASAPT
jgi:uncharacterized membrane protein YdjX (TVP38/TMEM64 family)